MEGVRVGRLIYIIFFLGFNCFAQNISYNPELSSNWQFYKPLMFGGKEINNDQKVVKIFLNTKTSDATTVPLMINGLIDQTPESFIKKIYIIVDNNPSPVAGVFNFSPDNGRVKIETRLRFEKFSFVRAVAEMNDGTLFQAAEWVKAEGGCSAPSAGSDGESVDLGKIRVRVDEIRNYEDPLLTEVQIKHPNESGLSIDFPSDKVARFIRDINVTYNDTNVFDGKVDFSLSDNPIIRFYFLPGRDGVLKINLTDTYDSVYTKTVNISKN